MVKAVYRFFLSARSDSPCTDLERHPKGLQPPEQLQAKCGMSKQMSKGKTAQVAESTQRFNQAMKKNEAEWQAKEKELEDQLGRMQSQNQRLENLIQQIQGELEHRTHLLEAKVQVAKSEKEKVEAEYNLFIRQKQEGSFKQMESAC